MEMGKILCRRRDVFLLSICAITVFVWVQLRHLNQQPHSYPGTLWSSSKAQEPLLEPNPLLREDQRYGDDVNRPANATLGFGRIIAISTRTSHRRTSLSLSADLTGLEISIPDQPVWTDADLANFKSKKHSVIPKGSALAWMGHLNALKWFMSQPYETALMIEDDVNWDIHIRNRQVPLLARAFHDIIERESREKGYIEYPDTRNGTKVERVSSLELKSKLRSTYQRESFWPSTKFWEILHVGHCGDFFPAKRLSDVLHTTYPDPSMSAFQGLHIDTQRFLQHMPIPPHHRLVHQSLRPLCTFAYAVTKASAARILKDFSTEEQDHGTVAYDVRILEACRDLGWRCWSANPELFHHLDDQASEIQAINGPKPADTDLDASPNADAQKSNELKPKEDGEKPSPEDTAKARARGTPNVACGIRTLVERMGANQNVREMVKLASEVDGMCPIPLEELDMMRAQIVERGRNGLPVG